MNSISDLVRQCFAAYESKDREAIEALLSDDFTFSSPLDDNISRERYFERCWPNSGHLRAFHIEKLLAEGNHAFVTYEAEQNDGAKFRNTEFFTSDGEKLKHVDVYFGTETGNAANEAEIRALIDRTAEACRAKDASALTANYATDVLAFDLVNPLRYRGSEAVGKRAAEWFSSWQGEFAYEVQDLTISASGDTAFGHSLNHVNGTKTDGQPVDMWWRATVCCERIDGKWLITHQHSSEPFDMDTGKASVGLKP
ncbi:MAG: nuclear transport factor 2 family protein [Gloeobacteraceae cyanobacterium ES-bin-144]|nr:nuclear transport factor 2 family protein [Verrucomicrobiales bacterium]